MKKFLVCIVFVFMVNYKNMAQVFSGSQEIEKTAREGAYILSTTDAKLVEKSWQAKLASIGKPVSTKGGFTIDKATIASVSNEPIKIFSKVTKQKDRTQIFISAVLADGSIVTNGHEKWESLSSFLTEYQNQLGLEDGVRIAEGILNETVKKQEKLIKNGSKLNGNVEDNKKDKEKLLKKLEDNRIELEKLLTDIETNKKDQVNMLTEVETKKRGVEEAKTRLPK